MRVMADRTLPPKKQKMALEPHAPTEDEPPTDNGVTNSDEEKEETEEDPEPVNVFQVTVVEGKRRHFVQKGQQELDEWLDEHIEEKEQSKVSLSALYVQYLELCMMKQIGNSLSQPELQKVLKSKFPKGTALKETSNLKEKVKVSKISNKTVTSKPKLSNKAIIREAFEDLKFPREGVMFMSLRKHMTPKHPTLRLDLRPNILLNGLMQGVRSGYIELLRGIGKAGKYRWYDAEADAREAEEEAERRKIKKQAKLEAGKSEEKTGEEKEASSEEKGDGEAASPAEGASEEGKPEQGKPEGEKREIDGEKKPAKKKAKKRRASSQKKRSAKKSSRIVHSDPQRIEDTFPLAMTFMAEPKQASFHQIEKYLTQHYELVSSDKLAKTLDQMADKGYLEKLSAGSRGTYQLTIDEFDPSDDDDLIGKVVNAIMASVQPKKCSSQSLRSYLVEFYPQFQVVEKPFLLKKAIERAVNMNMITQVSGIGLTGSYQLVDNFVPSPIILAGKDTDSDYEDDILSVSSADEGLGREREVDITLFQDAYKPRPTKRRGMARAVQKMSYNSNQAYFDAQLREMAARQLARHAGRNPKRASSSSGGRGRPGKSKQRGPAKRTKYAESSSAESSEEEEEEEEEEHKKPASSRGRPVSSAKQRSPAKKGSAAVTGNKKGSPAVKSASPSKSPSKKPAATPTSARRGRPSVKREPDSDADSDEDVDESYFSSAEKYVPRPSSSRGGTPRKAPAPAASKSPRKAATPAKPAASATTPGRGRPAKRETLKRKQ